MLCKLRIDLRRNQNEVKTIVLSIKKLSGIWAMLATPKILWFKFSQFNSKRMICFFQALSEYMFFFFPFSNRGCTDTRSCSQENNNKFPVISKYKTEMEQKPLQFIRIHSECCFLEETILKNSLTPL